MTEQTSTPNNSRRVLNIVIVVLIALAAIYVFYSFVYVRMGYWNGGDFAGRPVYSENNGFSWAAHHEAEKCGLTDDVVANGFDALDRLSPGDMFTANGEEVIGLDGRPGALAIGEGKPYGLGSGPDIDTISTIKIMKKGEGPYHQSGKIQRSYLKKDDGDFARDDQNHYIFELACTP